MGLTGWRIKSMKINFINNLINKIKKNKLSDLTSIFSKDKFQEVNNAKDYPCITSLVEA